jgi:hypothetical protein
VGGDPFSPALYEGEENGERYAGTGLAKRTLEVRFVDGAKIERHGFTVDGKGQRVPAIQCFYV